MERVAVYCGTRNVYEDMLPSVKSLLCHTRMDRIYFLIEDDEFPVALPEIIKVKNVAAQKYFKKTGPNYVQKWTWMVLMRAVLSKVLPNEHLVLSLDNDAIVKADISDLWSYDMTDYYFAGAREPLKSKDGYLYCNFGVNLQNLDKIRKDKIDNKAVKKLNSEYHFAPEQTVMNEVCQGHILEIPPNYNASTVTKMECGWKIRHYAAENNWTGYPDVGRYKWMKWSEVKYAKG